MTTSTLDSPRFGALPTVAPADWLIRLSVAATYLYHGFTKFPNMAAQAEFMQMPVALFALVAVVEMLGGAALIMGRLIPNALGDIVTRLGGVAVAVIMLGAIALVHWGQWSNMPSESHPFGGMEFQTLLLASGLFFALRGNRS